MKTKNKEYIRFDWAMKRLLRDKANFEILEGLISALLNTKMKIIEVLESESNRENINDKYNIVDVKAKNDKGEIVVVEVQNLFQMDFLKRILYGVSKAITEQLSLRDEYRKIHKVYSISIAYFDLGKGSDYLYHGRTTIKGVHTNEELGISKDELKAYDSEIASDIFPEYWVLRVNEFDAYAKTPLEEWMQYLKTGYIADDTKDPGLLRAKEVLKFDSMSKAEQEEYRRYFDQLCSERDAIEKAHNEGHQEGHQEGRQEEKIEIAKKLKAQNVDINIITQATGLTLEDIEKYKI
ncbi:MAG: Rpn family recombination-promoting nuclease/putative transposase [Bacteroidales bacterium]|nr:Rpn family recombination-promoting nuclease/putative transposase [Bacteroidales bacterium]